MGASMIDKIRDLGYKKVIGAILLGLICLVFVFIGAPTQQLGIGGGAAATVNNKMISIGEYRQELQRLEERYSSIFGGELGTSRQFLRSAALENLISRQVAAQGVEEQGLMATDLEVQSMIVDEIPAFKEDGRFRKSLYERYLQSRRISPGKFEDILRFESLNLRTRRLFELVGTPTKGELNREITLKQQKVNLNFIKLDKSILKNKIKISSSDVQKNLKKPSFKKKVESYYGNNKSEFEQKEEVRAKHILIKAQKGDSQAEKSALIKIKEIQSKLKKEDFSKLAKQYSEDVGSKGKGGDLGFFTRGRMVPEFEKVAFSLEKGSVSSAIQTSYGYHLIKVVARKKAKTDSLKSKEKDIARRLLQTMKVDGVLSDLKKSVERGNGEKVNLFAKKWKLKWEETGEFDRGAASIPKVGEDVLALAGVFQLSKGQMWKSVSVQGGAHYVLKIRSKVKDKLVGEPKGRKKLKEQLARSASNEIFNEWLTLTKKSFFIERNSRLLSRQ